LLDTHVLLWTVEGSLSPQASELIGERAEVVVASAASIWEIEIKRAQRRLVAPPDFLELVKQTGLEALPISLEHAAAAAQLPLHHRDPFDRMLVAQARLETLTLASADGALRAYDVPTVEIARTNRP
jgi:PIN domain nuclease of toxin-antitoxin system